MSDTTKKTNGTKTNSNTNPSKEKGTKEMTAKKTEDTKTDEMTASPQDESGTKSKLSDLEPVKMTMKEFEAMDAEALALVISQPHNRLSQERAKSELVNRISSGRVLITVPEILMDWTFKNVLVEDVDGTKIRGTKEPKETFTQEQFGNLSDTEKSELVEKYVNKRKVAESILPELVRKGMPLSPEDVVYLTNSRIAIQGVVIQNRGKKQVALTDGVEFA